MAQHDYVISNDTGANVRTDINNVLQAILTSNAGSTQPSTTQAGMLWGDMSNASTFYLKIRNHTNNGWNDLYAYDVATKTIQAMANGSTISSLLSAKANLASPTFTGTITADNINITDLSFDLGSLSTSQILQLRRGTTAQHSTFTGAVGELTIDTDKKTVIVHDGATAGGKEIVSTSGNQTIAGVKTFSSSPIVPTPTTDMQVSTKKYVDDLSLVHSATPKTTPADNDEIGLFDSASSFSLKKLTWYNLKATLKTYFFNTNNVLVGTTTDNGVDKLQVNGSISASNIYSASSFYKEYPSQNTWYTAYSLGDLRWGGIFKISSGKSGVHSFLIVAITYTFGVDTHISTIADSFYGGGVGLEIQVVSGNIQVRTTQSGVLVIEVSKIG